ncbi:MAG: phospholipase D family protein [Candidatus Dasytiphilus stammeri]
MKIRTYHHRILIILIFFILPAQATEILVGFSPGNSASNIILNAINEAHHKIDMAVYSFTSKPISIALLEAIKRGVKIRIIADEKANHDKYTAITFLVNHGVSIKLNRHYTIMHNKFIIIDENSIQTGSYNYTSAAAKHNAENVIFIKDALEIALQYTNEFNRLWKESTIILQPKY